MKSLLEYINEAIADNLKSMISFLSKFEFEPLDINGWRFKKDSYKITKKPKNEFKISIKDAHNFASGNSDRYGFYIYNVYVFIKPFEFENETYLSVVFRKTDEGDWSCGEDFCVLNSTEGLNPFIRWCFKPHKYTSKSDIGPDGELKIWYEKMPKSYTPEIKPYVCNKKLVEKMGDIVKINCTN